MDVAGGKSCEKRRSYNQHVRLLRVEKFVESEEQVALSLFLSFFFSFNLRVKKKIL